MISIIVPVYNEEKYLPQCLNSLINQTYQDIEIICVNDGSTDGSLSILELYAAKDERVKIISQTNQGLSEARNIGIKAAQGEWMMFVDSDDWLETDCCQKVVDFSKGVDFVFFSYIREFRNSSAPKYVLSSVDITFREKEFLMLFERLIAPKGKELRQPDKIDSLSTAWGKMYRTDIIKDQQLKFVSIKEIGTEDLLFNVEYFRFIHCAVYLHDALYHYRKATLSTLSSFYKDELDKKWLRLFERIKDIITPLNNSELLEALCRRKALCLLGLGLNITFCKESFIHKHQMLEVIISSDWYSSAVTHLDTSSMPLHWKCFYGAARHKQAWAVLMMLQGINIIINR